MQKNSRLILVLIIVIALNCGVVYGNVGDEINYQRGVILHATELMNDPSGESEALQYVSIKITSGEYKGKIFDSKNIISGRFVYDFPVEVGDKVVVFLDESDDGIAVHISDYRRDQYIGIVALIFILLLIIIGKKTGLKTIMTLSLTVFSIFKFMIPMLLKGHSPALLAIGVAIVVTVITLITIGGFSSKSFAAIIGTTVGVLVAGLIAYTVGSLVRLTGLSSEEAIMLMYVRDGVQLNFKELLFAGILLGALGAVMDVSISIASSIEEVYKANSRVTPLELFASGMNVGKDIMGTMANTLILAYTGSSIPLLMLFMSTNTSFIKIMNFDIIATEVVRALSGSIGLIITIPSTAIVSCLLIYSSEKKKEKIGEK